MAAVAYVHERGVAHCSLGAGSLLLSTFSDGKAEQLVVKLDNFGFSQRLSLPSGVPLPSPSAIAPQRLHLKLS